MYAVYARSIVCVRPNRVGSDNKILLTKEFSSVGILPSEIRVQGSISSSIVLCLKMISRKTGCFCIVTTVF